MCKSLHLHVSLVSIAGTAISKKLIVEGVASYALSPSAPYKIAVYVPGSKVYVHVYT